ncbi:MAG: UDP-glucose--hexose-1-phosphate uridylyltransferase [Proteobacteria bacterium]|nr:MAG: UDP-glucose--hexose-1-phosphate uridylyltransferase [Pseudomonadota bacterium]
MTIFDQPHRRQNALTGDWVLVSPRRTMRPWQGERHYPESGNIPCYDPECYLCPGNNRASGNQNPDYTGPYIFQNDFPSLLPETEFIEKETPLFKSQSVSGNCRVLCFSERHDLSLPELELSSIEKVVQFWVEEYKELAEKYRWVQIFENKGEQMGCSNPHPHGQIWAGDFLPNELHREEQQQREYFESHGSPLLSEYLDHELRKKQRLVELNEHWLSVVPWWAIWPFETLIIPKRHVTGLHELSGDEQAALAELLKNLLSRYDNLFQASFPYSMGWHGASFFSNSKDAWRLHAHIYPPLLRSSTIRKFMVGYEMLAEVQRDISPEQASARLRECSTLHYSKKA